MSTAVFGGSFDPVHIGHLFVLHNVLSMTDYRRILVIPAHISNFKQNKSPLASDSDRLAMVCAALNDFRNIYPQDGISKITVSTCELERGGVSYTGTTVRQIRAQYPDNEPTGIIIGDDCLENLEKWYDFEYLRQNAEFIICRRDPCFISTKIPNGIIARFLATDKTAPQSSNSFRNNPENTKDYLSPGVLAYASARGLYGLSKKNAYTLEDVSSYLRKTVSHRRYVHSLGVADMTKKVFKHYNINSETWNGFSAPEFCGLIHDLGREFPDEAILFICRENNISLSDYEKTHPVTTHGALSVILAQSAFGDFPQNWKDAVRNHTTGCANMDELALALFIADYIEPGRTFMNDEQRNRILSLPDIYGCALEVLTMMMNHWKEKKLNYMCPSTDEMYKDLIKRTAK